MILTQFNTKLGEAKCGNSLEMLTQMQDQSVDLIVTSPPFGLVRQKTYGNEPSDQYVEWFKAFAVQFRRVLVADGSLVIDLGGAWNEGVPTRSLYHFKLLIVMCEEFGFHLCQDYYWWNPSKLPTPAEWVTVRRVRVKDAVNCIWWLSPTPWPRANNRRVLNPYSAAMRHLLKNGYQPRLRPSGHDISSKFGTDNSGSIPPNLLAIANTRSTDSYRRYCERNALPIHPARFPAELPAYFVSLLSDPGHLVLDPFAGSCMTGAVCEAMGRRWVCCELNDQYIEGGKGYFQGDFCLAGTGKRAGYTIGMPSFMTATGDLPALGTGRTRTRGSG